MINTEISIFKGVWDVACPYHKTIGYFLGRIKNGSAATEKILRYRETNDDDLKKSIPAATFCGTFSYRNSASLMQFSQFACLDFDKYEDAAKAIEIKNEISKDPCVFACFISTSGKGVKAIFRVANEPDKYESMYRALCLKYKDAHLDKKTKDISRLCFESYDPDIYINEAAIEWANFEEEDASEVGVPPQQIIVPMRSEMRIIDILQKWFDRKYSMSKGSRNDNIFTFAIMLNKFGVNLTTAKHHLSKYAEGNFSEKEISLTVASAYKKFSNEFGTRFFEDNETKRQIKTEISKGKTPADIKRSFQKGNNPIATNEEDFDNIIETLRGDDDVDTFWEYSDKGKISLIPHKYDLYLSEHNFMKYYPESSQDTFIFVQKDKTLIESTTKDRIKDFVLNDLRKRDGIGNTPFNYMASNTKYFTNEFLNMLQAVDIEIKRDTKDQCFLYYQNCVVEIGVDYVKQLDYIDIDKYVWKKTVINRDFAEYDHHKSEFRSFLWYIAGQDVDSYNCFKSAIGYLMHSFKTSADNKAIILNDEIISDTPNGRSGKGLFFTALRNLKKVDVINGKDFSFDKNFRFQTVSTDCQILVFDDVRRNFEFENLFSVITEGIEIEYKNQGTVKLPVEKSPKIVITTNYTIKGEGGSFDARKHELELSSYFNKNFTPIDHFGHRLFDNWDENEWHRFDNFMIQCVQYYLKNGLQVQHHKNLSVRKFMSETSNEFYEWSEGEGNLTVGARHYNKETFDRFIDEYPDFRNKLQIKTFKRWVKTYCDFKHLSISEGNANGQRYFYISVAPIDAETAKDENDNLPF